ncbi:hypothetical protein [Hymenobacter frigidus]|jgi:hypothetical protein|uniref:hypothetical protein n=1 Tax=Hymenobacter frigidus TaxID=1524095 RepID=UPI0016671FCD|nr:hypothetical protein [Hymenobacter frigidus]
MPPPSVPKPCVWPGKAARPKPIRANHVWVSDTTYLPLATGMCTSPCAFQDAGTKHVVG